MPEPGDLLVEKYRLTRLLGEGGMGAVYEAVHERIGKRLAVKMLLPELSQNDELVKRFSREAEAAAAIGHPAIIDIHDLGQTDDGSMFLVMEFLEGQSLGELLEKTPVLEPAFVAYVVCQVLSALDATHAKKIVHRDLKPDNIFLVDKGKALPEVKLLDFGISKIANSNDPDLQLTVTGTLLGTPYYMAPEQGKGIKDLDHLVDIYAMGVILYECLCGQCPFLADNYLALVNEVINNHPPAPTQLRPDLSPDLERVIVSAMAKDKSQRFQTAAHMLEATLPFVDASDQAHLSLGKVSGTSGVTELNRTPMSDAGLVPPKRGMGSSSIPGGAVLPVPARGRSSRPVALVVLIMLAFLATGTVGTILLFGSRETVDAQRPRSVNAAVASPNPTKTPQTPIAPSDDGGAIADERSESLEVVTVTLRNVPEQAQILLDNEPVEGPEIQRPRSTDEHVLRIEHADHQPYQETITFEQNTMLLVRLLPEGNAPPTGGSVPSATSGRRQPSTKSKRPVKRPSDRFMEQFDD